MGRSDAYRRYAAECVEMASAFHEPKARAALLQMAWDHVASALDGRESAFELHASGGVPAWRGRLPGESRDVL